MTRRGLRGSGPGLQGAPQARGPENLTPSAAGRRGMMVKGELLSQFI